MIESGFKNYNNHDKLCFRFHNTDSYISRLAATFVFQAFESERKMIINYISFNYIGIYLTFFVYYCIPIGNTMYGRNGNTE